MTHHLIDEDLEKDKKQGGLQKPLIKWTQPITLIKRPPCFYSHSSPLIFKSLVTFFDQEKIYFFPLKGEALNLNDLII